MSGLLAHNDEHEDPLIDESPPLLAPVGGHTPAWARGVPRAMSIYAISRLAVLMAIGTATVIKEQVPIANALAAWDSGWYLTIATSGYDNQVPSPGVTSNLAFFPLFPLVVKAGAALTGLTALQAALALNAVLGLVTAAVIWLLASELGDQRFADRAVALFAFFPGSFVLSLAYSEPLMLPMAAGCLLALLRRHWVLAGLLAGLASATRPNAIALCVCCAVAAGIAIIREREWRALVAPALSPIGLIAFVVYLWLRTGDPMATIKAQRLGWAQGFDFGLATAKAAADVVQHPAADLNKLVATMTLAFVVVAAVALARWRPPAVVVVYTGVVIALGFLSPALSSKPRFALTAFPLIFAVARVARGSVLHAAVGSSAVLLAALAMISTTTIDITP